MTDEAYNLKWKNHTQNLYSKLDKLYFENAFVDVTLCCRDGQLKAHRLVLSACSVYFENILRDNHCDYPIIIFNDVQIDQLSKLVNFIYKGSVEVLKEDFSAFMKLADDFKVKGLCFEETIDNFVFPDNQTQEATNMVDALDNKIPVKCENTDINHPDSSENVITKEMLEESNTIVNRKDELVSKTDQLQMCEQSENLSKKKTIKKEQLESSEFIKQEQGKSIESSGVETRFKGQKRVNVSALLPTGRLNKHWDEWGDTETVNKKQKTKQKKSSDCPILNKPSIKVNIHQDSSVENSNNSANNLPEVNMFGISSLCEEDLSSTSTSNCCDVCGVDCKTGSQLRRHQRVHTDDKPYQCDTCPLSFRRSSHLARHRRVHTGERPFPCPICGTCFSRRDKLKQHVWKFHGAEEWDKMIEDKEREKLKIDNRVPQAVEDMFNSFSNAFEMSTTFPPNSNALLPFADTRYLSSLSLGQQKYNSQNQTAAEDLLDSVRQLGECTIQPITHATVSAGAD